jgi:sulfur transfer protein SufE
MDTLSDTRGATSFDEILADFELLDDWEDRYRYVIELGRRLEPLPRLNARPPTRCKAASARCGSPPRSIKPTALRA